MFPTDSRRAARLLVMAAVVLGVAGGTAWTAWSSTSGSEEISRSTKSPTGVVETRGEVGQADSAADAVKTTTAGLDQGVFEDVYVGTSPNTWDRQGPWFHARLTPEEGSPAIPVGLWEADLAQGAIAERLANGEPNLANVIVGSTISADRAADVSEPEWGGSGDVQAGQAFSARSRADSELIKSALETLERFPLANTQVRVLHALDPALMVTADVKTPKDIDGIVSAIREGLLGNPSAFEGLYLRIDAPDVGPLVISSVAYRSGVGRLWIAPGFDEFVDIPHGGGAPVVRDDD